MWKNSERPVGSKEKSADGGSDAGPGDVTPRRRFQRKPDGDEAIDSDEHDDPCGHVLKEENEEVDAFARKVVDVHQFEAGDDSDPSLEAADVEDGRVGDG